MKPIRYKILGYLQIFVGMGAISGGLPMVLSPDGSTVGMGVELLEKTPFVNYLLPGLMLVVVNGVGQLIGAYNSLKFRSISGVLGIVLGAALIIWILMQMFYLGYSSWMQALFLAIGTVELFLALGIYKKTSLQKSK